MATIAKLIVGIDGDPTGLRRAFKQSANFVQKFQQEVGAANRASINNTANFLNRLNKDFTQTASRLREDVFRGVIDPKKFQAEGLAAGREFNAGIISEIDRLSKAGTLTEPIRRSLVGRLKDVGLEAGAVIAKSLAERLKSAGDDILKSGRKLSIGLSLPLVLAGGFAFKEATRDESALVKMTNTFGAAAKDVTASLAEIRKTVPAELDVLQDFTSGLDTMLVTMGVVPKTAQEMSIGIVRLAGDLAAFKQVPIEESMEAIRAGMTGATRGLKQFGIVIDEAEIKSNALRMGLMKQGQELTQSGTALSFYSLLLQRSSLQQGAAARMAGLSGTQLAMLKVELMETASTIGGQLIPILVPLLKQFSDFLRHVQQMNPETLGMIVKLGLFAAALGPIVSIIGGLTKGMGALIGVIGVLKGGAGFAGLLTLVSPGGLVVAGLLAVAAAVALIWFQMNKGKKEIEDYKNSLKDLSGDQLGEVAEQLAGRRRALEAVRNPLTRVLPNGKRVAKLDATAQDIDTILAVNRELDVVNAKLKAVSETWAEVRKGEQAAADQLAQFQKLLSQINTATATTPEGKSDPFGVTKQLIAAQQSFEELKRSGPLAIKLGTAILDTYSQLEKQLAKLEKTDPFGETANNLRDILKTMRELSLISSSITVPTGPLSNITRLPKIATPPPTSPKVQITEITETTIRLRQLRDAAESAGKSLLGALGSFGLRIIGLLNPLNALAEVFGPLAEMISTTLAPIVKELVDALAPVVGALLQVLAPILRALIPIFLAFIPILKALFPLIKFAAIGLTYFIQALAIAGSVVARVIGNIIIAIGEIFKALAKAVDALPGVSAKGAIKTAQGVIDFGRAMLKTSDEFKKTADGMAQARDEIRAATWEDATNSVTDLGDAAATAAQQILNAVSGYKVEYLRYAAQDAIRLADTSSGASSMPASTTNFYGDINIDAKSLSRKELFNMVRDEARSVALSKFGDTSRAAEALA